MEEEYDFDNWLKDVPVDEVELKRKEKKKRKAEHKKIREEAKKKREEKEKLEEKDEGDEKLSEDEKKVKKDKKDKKDRKEKKKEKKDKKKDKKRKKDDTEDSSSDSEESESENENENKKESKKRKKEDTTTTKKGEFGVWIGNLAFSTTEEMIRKFLNKCGKISRINLPINKQTKNNKGFAYVDFEDQESMENAIKLSEQTLENRNLLIKSSKDFRGRPAKQIAGDNKEKGNGMNNGARPTRNNTNGYNKEKKESPTLFIGNLPYAATAEGITKCFKEFGEISNVRVATFEDNQEKCKGFAYVDYANVESATKAVNAIKKPKLLGRILRVEYAGEEATRRGYNKLHKKQFKEKPTKPAEPKPIAIAKWDGEVVTFKGKKTVFNDDDEE